jgi:radical SAM superfamily enzyme YgiQ (UPF0313 family)
MKITLISSLLMDYIDGCLSPISMDRLRECPPYGLYLLAAILSGKGYDVTIVDLVAQGSLDLSLYEKVIQNSNLIGISATSLSWPSARDIIKSVRQICHETPIVLGGIHPTMFDEYILSTLPVNYVIRGEAEIALPLLVEAIDKKKDIYAVPNLSVMEDNRLRRTTLHTPLTGIEMSQFPLPDYGNAPLSVYKGIAIESSRGCPFNCSFCSTSYRGSWRGMSSEEFVMKVEAVKPYCQNTQLGYMQIVDDEFSANRKRATDIAKLISKKSINVSLVFDSRANDMIHEDFVDAIAPHTFRFLVGAECGYDEGLRRIGKGTTCDKLEKAASVAHKYGINKCCDFSFILGLPWETKEEVVRTVRFACRLYAKYGVRIMLQWYCQIPGSSLWEQATIEGKVNASIYDNYGFFRSPYLFLGGVSLSPEEIWEISDSIAPVLKLSKVNESGEDFIQYAVPEPVVLYFNRHSLGEGSASALHNLRDLSRNVRQCNIT